MASLTLKKIVKITHEIGAVGYMGALAAMLVLALTAPQTPAVAFAAARLNMAAISHWILVPSLALVAVSGLLAIAMNRTFINAGWPWAKALTGITMFEGTLVTVDASMRHAAELAVGAAAGSGDPQAMQEALHAQWGGIAVMLTMCLANIVLAVWRPRFYRAPPGVRSAAD